MSKIHLIMRDFLTNQYEMVKESRGVVFKFCEEFSSSDYNKEIEGFGRGSICKTQTHIANTYTFWIANSLMGKILPYLEYKSFDKIIVYKAFDTINSFMKNFIEEYSEDLYSARTIKIKDGIDTIQVTPFQAFTHVVTHEFHHKGQIMTMGRLLGYTPPDADIIRFS